MVSISEAVENLKAASGPTYELNADVYEALGFQVGRVGVGRRSSYRYRRFGERAYASMGRLTSSVDDLITMISLYGKALDLLDVMEVAFNRLTHDIDSGLITVWPRYGQSWPICRALLIAFLEAHQEP